MATRHHKQSFPAVHYHAAPIPSVNEVPWLLDVLAIDDDPSDLWLTANALRADPRVRRVFPSDSPEEVIPRLKDGGLQPHLVVVDLRMPKTDGFSFISDMRAIPSLNRIPIVLLTTSRFARDVSVAGHMNIRNYVIKPDSFEKLKLRLGEVITQIMR